jgi:hypothetical protein
MHRGAASQRAAPTRVRRERRARHSLSPGGVSRGNTAEPKPFQSTSTIRITKLLHILHPSRTQAFPTPPRPALLTDPPLSMHCDCIYTRARAHCPTSLEGASTNRGKHVPFFTAARVLPSEVAPKQPLGNTNFGKSPVCTYVRVDDGWMG